jgi:hypothetical protein
MAYEVKKRERLKLHQVLHGYADGHHQLAASVTLKPRDIKTMLVLSDISGPGASLKEEGYLTGYPLVDSGMYALGRTWAAPEMPRPGCVWTHTVLIDFADLARLNSLANLLTLFRRPSGPSFGEYGKAFTFAEQASEVPLPHTAQAWSRRVMAGLYGKPQTSVIAVHPADVDVDQAILAIWSQQWPRLRRTFRFCTFAAADRSTDRNRFDLQLLPSADRSIRTRFLSSIDIETVKGSAETWLDDAVTDLVQVDASGLRTFIRRIGADVATGREAFRPLCRLHRLVNGFNSSPESLSAAIALLQNELGSGVQARAAKAMIVNAAIYQFEVIPDDVLEYLVLHSELIDPNFIKNDGIRLGCAIWRRDPSLLGRLLGADEDSEKLLELIIGSLSTDELIRGLHRIPGLTRAVLNQRPELITEHSFWTVASIDLDSALGAISKIRELRHPAVTALISAQRHDLALRVVREIGPLEMLQIIGAELEVSKDRNDFGPWIAASAKDPYVVAQYLTSGSKKSRTLLVALARIFPPDHIPNDVGTDPWVTANLHSVGSITEEEVAYLSAYFLSRALGLRSRSIAELSVFGFNVTHMALAKERLPIEAWWLLEHRLPRYFWPGWDQCQRLRIGVVDLFVEHDLSPQFFTDLTADDDLFIELINIAVKSKKGRRYVKRVLHMLKGQVTCGSGNRIFKIETLLNQDD